MVTRTKTWLLQCKKSHQHRHPLLNSPLFSFHRSILYSIQASKAAVISFYETLRVEFGKDIGLTIVTPGLIESEMTRGKFISKEGDVVVDPDMRDVSFSAYTYAA